MKNSRVYLLSTLALALGHWGAPASASTSPAADPLEEIPDAELGAMRGRYTVGENTVAWFGVKMISTWKTGSDQLLQGALVLSMDFRKDGQRPQVSFQPSVTITRADAPIPDAAVAATYRTIDGAGLTNVGGVLQSVQVAGDGNVAGNVASLRVSDGGDPSSGSTGTASSGVAAAYGDGTSAVASFDGRNASVLLTIDGQGAVEQWIRHGSLGQSVQLTADDQWVSNRMEIELVRQTVAANVQLTQNVAQAINFARGIGLH